MRKLAYSIIKRLIEYGSTTSEVDLLLYLARIADEKGFVQAVHYRAACMAMGNCAMQTYYNALRSLREHEVITFEKNNYYDIDVQIIGNNILASKYEKGKTPAYLSLNRDILHDKEFHSLTAKEKLLLLQLLVQTQSNTKQQIRMHVDTFYHKFQEELRVTRETLQGYIKHLKLFFSIGIKDGFFYVEARRFVNRREHKKDRDQEQTIPVTDKTAYYEHVAQAAVIRDNADIAIDQIPGIAGMLNQYYNYLQEKDAVKLLIYIFRQMKIPKRRRGASGGEQEHYKLSIPYLNTKLHDNLISE